MAQTDPRSAFSIHEIVAYSRSTSLPYGSLRVVQGGEVSLAGENIDLFGGSSLFPWASEAGDFESEFTFTASEYPDWMFELFLGATVTENAAEAAGAVSALVNVTGTSVFNATTGCASVSVLTAADLKFGRYIIKPVTSTTVHVYLATTLDRKKGTDLTIQDDDLRITASALTVPSGSTVAIPNTGLEIDGGSGTIGMTANDTAYFDVRPINTGSSIISVGSSGSTFPEFGAWMSANKRSNGELFVVHAFRAKGAGMPIGFTRNEWAEPELTMKLLQDATVDKVFDIYAIKGEA